MIKSNKSRVVGMDLKEKLSKANETSLYIDIDMQFKRKTTIQKILLNQGILLSYKKAKYFEKRKFYIFNLIDEQEISESMQITLCGFLNLEINQVVSEVFKKATKSNFELTGVEFSK
jgi:hypothetical protein